MSTLFFLLVAMSISAISVNGSSGPQTTSTTTSTKTTTTIAVSTSDKIISSWYKTNGTNYNKHSGSSLSWNMTNQVMHVYYNNTYVWINANSAPYYTIGLWSDNPNTPSSQNNTYYFAINPSAAYTTTYTTLGAIGVWLDGTEIYDAWDGEYYTSPEGYTGVWERNAYFWESVSFDSCNGHPDVFGIYHTHINPVCMYTLSSSSHSPLLGFAFDSYPIYGPYGYSSANDSSSSVKLLQSSYWTRNYTQRTSLANGTVLNSNYYGPTINTTYPLGSYLQDYEYVSGYGDLDIHNGRWCVTPEYPSGTYAYFVSMNSSGISTYPFIVGPSYYGNYLGQTGVTVPSGVKTYF